MARFKVSALGLGRLRDASPAAPAAAAAEEEDDDDEAASLSASAISALNPPDDEDDEDPSPAACALRLLADDWARMATDSSSSSSALSRFARSDFSCSTCFFSDGTCNNNTHTFNRGGRLNSKRLVLRGDVVTPFVLRPFLSSHGKTNHRLGVNPRRNQTVTHHSVLFPLKRLTNAPAP